MNKQTWRIALKRVTTESVLVEVQAASELDAIEEAMSLADTMPYCDDWTTDDVQVAYYDSFIVEDDNTDDTDVS